MTDNEKMIKSINHYLTKLNEKHLRLVLLLLYQFDKFPEKEEV